MHPCVFYRVQHDSSRVTYCPRTGFTSEKQLRGDPCHLRRSLDIGLVHDFEAHCNKDHVPTPLISVCSCPHLTLERAQTEQRYGRTGIKIYKIYAGGWRQGRPYWHIDLFDARGFAKEIQQVYKEKVIEPESWDYLEDEYLVINNIPNAVVVGWLDLEVFIDCMYPDICIGVVS